MMFRSMCAAAAMGLMAGCIIVPIPIPVGSSIPDPSSVSITPATTGFGAMMVSQRAAVGVGPVEENAQLTAAANAYARRLDTEGFFDHVAPDGSKPSDRALAAGYCDQYVGENLAYGQTSEIQVMQDWMASAGHRENILNPRFVRYGLGRYGDKWVLMLGDACTF